jgi:hypothetical protein
MACYFPVYLFLGFDLDRLITLPSIIQRRQINGRGEQGNGNACAFYWLFCNFSLCISA